MLLKIVVWGLGQSDVEVDILDATVRQGLSEEGLSSRDKQEVRKEALAIFKARVFEVQEREFQKH